MFEDFAIDTGDFSVRHDPQLLGLFEPVSAIMFLNIDDLTFEQWREALGEENQADGTHQQLTEVFLHEAYHCFQTYTTGYLYEQFSRLAGVWAEHQFSLAPWLVAAPLIGRHLLNKTVDALTLWMTPDARRMLSEVRRYQLALRHYTRLHRRAVKYKQGAISGALMPELYTAIDRVRAPSLVRGADGLSAKDVIEGAAFVYGREATYPADYEERLHDSGLDPDGPYQRLLKVTTEQCPGRPPSLIRAAAALALRYEHPGAAYRPLLARLAAGGTGDEVHAARSLSREMPDIPNAGRLVGTASDAHTRLDHKFPNLYRPQLDQLTNGVWGIDGLDLLIDTQAINSIPTGELGFAIVTRDGRRGFGSLDTMGVRLVISTTMLPTGPSVAQLRRDLLSAINNVGW